jgi:hypothetical protein
MLNKMRGNLKRDIIFVEKDNEIKIRMDFYQSYKRIYLWLKENSIIVERE